MIFYVGWKLDNLRREVNSIYMQLEGKATLDAIGAAYEQGKKDAHPSHTQPPTPTLIS